MTDNHDYATPAKGATDWHVPLNDNFEQLDADIEIRDTIDSLSEYDPKEGAKFLATDTGVVYAGVDTADGTGETTVEWVPMGVIADGDSFGNEALGEFALVHGGLDNRARGDRATVLGGKGNVASGRGSLAAGVQAHAIHDGATVFGDHTSSEVRSRSTAELRSQMPVYAPSFHTTSARAEKTDLDTVDPETVLAEIDSLEIHTWRLAAADTGRHMGPTAEDFRAQFDLGDTTDSIATVDADGVALAGIQGLSARLDDTRADLDASADRLDEQCERIAELETENERLRGRNADLEERLAAVETSLELDGAER